MNMTIYTYILNYLNEREWLSWNLAKLWVRICGVIEEPWLYDYIWQANGMPEDMTEVIEEVKNDAFILFKQLHKTLNK